MGLLSLASRPRSVRWELGVPGGPLAQLGCGRQETQIALSGFFLPKLSCLFRAFAGGSVHFQFSHGCRGGVRCASGTNNAPSLSALMPNYCTNRGLKYDERERERVGGGKGEEEGETLCLLPRLLTQTQDLPSTKKDKVPKS